MNEIAAGLSWLVEPLHSSMVLGAIAAIIWLARWRRSGVALLLIAAGWSVLWSMPAAAEALRDSLQRPYLGQSAEGVPESDVIVVLGGDIGPLSRFTDKKADAPDLADSPVAAAARAWHAQRAPAILLSGGPSRATSGVSEARIMADALNKLGVPEQALVLDDRSSNTRQNAEHSARIAGERGWRRVILVTSAMHMPRALRWFQYRGLPALPLAPAEGPSPLNTASPWEPSMQALDESGRALREYAGLLAIGLS